MRTIGQAWAETGEAKGMRATERVRAGVRDSRGKAGEAVQTGERAETDACWAGGQMGPEWSRGAGPSAVAEEDASDSSSLYIELQRRPGT